METEITGLKSAQLKAVLSRENNKFSNVLDKLRNVRIGEAVAWSEIQPVLSYCVEDYPEKFKDTQEAIRVIFEIRRKAYFSEVERDNASGNVRKALSGLPDEQRDLLVAPTVCIRDVFDINQPKLKSRI